MPKENPYSRPPFRSAHYAQQTSAFAVLSMLCGLAAVPLMCMCFLSVPFSIAAIIFGHSARGVVRNSPERYEGFGMATSGMLLGYVTLAVCAAFLAIPIATNSVRIPTAATRNQGANQNPLLIQAEDQLLAGTEQNIFGVTTTNASATDLAQHYLEALQILDQTHFDEGIETETAAASPRAYRVFVQLNSDSAAFLLHVPEYQRFTEDAKETLNDNAWLIAQRSVDDILPRDSQLAVCIYSAEGQETVMIGQTSRDGSTAPKANRKDRKRLASLFRLAQRVPRPDATGQPKKADTELIPIDRKPEIVLPAERELPVPEQKAAPQL